MLSIEQIAEKYNNGLAADVAGKNAEIVQHLESNYVNMPKDWYVSEALRRTHVYFKANQVSGPQGLRGPSLEDVKQ